MHARVDPGAVTGQGEDEQDVEGIPEQIGAQRNIRGGEERHHLQCDGYGAQGHRGDPGSVAAAQDQHSEEKIAIARYAASLIEPEDFVYLDAGTTTFKMLEFLDRANVGQVAFVTNGIQHAAKLASLGFRVYLPGGRLKANTQAVIGTEAIRSLSSYNFTKGFFGANGMSSTAGFSTPDFSEGNVKTEAVRHCQRCFVLADSSKFKKVFPVTFAKLQDASIVTDFLPDKKYSKLTNVIEAGERK